MTTKRDYTPTVAKCLVCHTVLEMMEYEEPAPDTHYHDYVKPCWGICPICGRRYKWFEVWDYTCATDVESID